jgi:hypothetical protein
MMPREPKTSAVLPAGQASAGSDAALIEQSRAEPARFAEVFDRYYAEIHCYASRRLGRSLADDVAAETPHYHAYSLFTHILRENVLSPTLQAAIFRAMKKIPGVTLDRKFVDVLGRPTLALGMNSSGMHEDTLLDGKTYTYRGERTLAVTDAFDKPQPCKPEPCPPPPLIRKGTEFVFARITTAVVDRPGQIPTS